MFTKTFRAASMPEALAKVQADLGLDALVLASHKVMDSPVWQVWREPEVEVLAMPAHAPTAPAPEKVSAPAPVPEAKADECETLTQFRDRLLAQEVEPKWVAQIINDARQSLGPRLLAQYASVRDYLARDLAQRLQVGAYLPRKGVQQVVTLLGMAGAGKTVAAAKLAAYAHYTLGRRVALISLDTFRVGALDQMQTYANILRLPLAIAYTPTDLNASLASHSDKDVIVIDTPSRNLRQAAEMIELMALLTNLPAACANYFVADATAKLSDLTRAVEAFKVLGLHGLIFSKLDETDTFGALYSLARRTALPLSYFSNGRRVPDDMAPASAESLAEWML
ncbi:MAG: hypothetical protein AABZ78_19720 [Chloroflexota bacterium]